MTKKLLCMMLILGLSAATANATLVGWWKFDEAGGGDALDSAPAAGANTGVSNGTTPRVASGVAGLGLAADLTPNGAGDNFFDVGTASGALNPADVFSVAAWVNVKGNGGGAWGGPSSAFGFGDCCAGTAAGAADRHAFELDIDDCLRVTKNIVEWPLLAAGVYLRHEPSSLGRAIMSIINSYDNNRIVTSDTGTGSRDLTSQTV